MTEQAALNLLREAGAFDLMRLPHHRHRWARHFTCNGTCRTHGTYRTYDISPISPMSPTGPIH
jgi:hypothetical protein